MNGIFSDTLKSCANWFLYIFIEEWAPLNSSIMKKRANQIMWLKRLDAINPTYTYNDLVNIVYSGIVKMYGQTPAEVLKQLYTAGTSSIRGITDVNNVSVTVQNPDGTKSKKNFWDSLNEVLKYLLQIIESLGFGKKNDIQPIPADWYNPSSSKLSNSLTSIFPWAAAAGIIFFVLKDE